MNSHIMRFLDILDYWNKSNCNGLCLTFKNVIILKNMGAPTTKITKISSNIYKFYAESAYMYIKIRKTETHGAGVPYNIYLYYIL